MHVPGGQWFNFAIKLLFKNNMASGITLKSGHLKSFCPSCCKGKSTRKPFNKKSGMDVASLKICEHMYGDLVGEFPTKTKEGYEYALCISDHRSHYAWIFLLRNKGQTASKLMSLFNLLSVVLVIRKGPSPLSTQTMVGNSQVLSWKIISLLKVYHTHSQSSIHSGIQLFWRKVPLHNWWNGNVDEGFCKSSKVFLGACLGACCFHLQQTTYSRDTG